jgi:hypothetical protein
MVVTSLSAALAIVSHLHTPCFVARVDASRDYMAFHRGLCQGWEVRGIVVEDGTADRQPKRNGDRPAACPARFRWVRSLPKSTAWPGHTRIGCSTWTAAEEPPAIVAAVDCCAVALRREGARCSGRNDAQERPEGVVSVTGM